MNLLNEIINKVENNLFENIEKLNLMLKSNNTKLNQKAKEYIENIVKNTSNPYLEKLTNKELEVLKKTIDFEKNSISKMMNISIEQNNNIYMKYFIQNEVYSYCKNYKKNMTNQNIL